MKKILVLPLMLSLLCSCNNESFSYENLDIILHAGGGINNMSYMNAQEPFLYYYNLGYRYFEYDLKLSTDGKIIGTHAFEHLDVNKYDFTYEEFKELRLTNGYTPVNEEWLIQTIKDYNDITIVVDAKMDDTIEDAKVLQRLEKLESIYKIDISKNILPEIFSIEMWDIVKNTTTFDRYFYSQYKSYYSFETIIENFLMIESMVWLFLHMLIIT